MEKIFRLSMGENAEFMAALLFFCLQGLAAGALYDMLGCLRLRINLLAGAADILFCLLTGAAIFINTMAQENGRLGLWLPAAAFCGFLLYLNCLERYFHPVFDSAVRILLEINSKIKIFFKNLMYSVKNVFKKREL